MQRKKVHIDARIQEANIDKGIIVLLTGNGKGKSSCLTISRREKVITACGCEPLRAGGNDNNECIFNDIVINYQSTNGFTDPKNTIVASKK
jgi:hypothetical protein